MDSNLKHLDEFEKVLHDYRPNRSTIEEIFEKHRLVVVTSPTGGGRNTIINKLVDSGDYEFFLSDTTRPPRMNNGVMEQDGVEYNFKHEDEMLEGLRSGEYLEAAIVHKNHVYGTSLRQFRQADESNNYFVVEADIQGADEINNFLPSADFLFVLPPNFDEWMRRLQARGDMDSEEMTNRLESAEEELQVALDREYYKFVINDDLDTAVQDARAIIENRNYPRQQDERAKEIAWQLLGKVKQQLNS